MSLFAWSLLLVVQNAAFTWVSRARNSGSYGYHAVAAIASNGTYFAVQFVLVSMVAQGVTFGRGLLLGLVYVASTTAGSVLMHWVSIRFLERGKRRVGATTP